MKTRHVVLIMLALLSIITYTDRLCISVAAEPMQKALGLTDIEWNWVLSAFLVGYGLFEIPSGGLGDRWGQRKVLTRIVAWWSAFTILTGVATNYWALIFTRFLFGAGEAGAYPNASGCIGRWFPLHERARAQGIVWGSSRIGGALTPLLVMPLLKTWHWQMPFFVFGAIGFVWAAAWFIWFRDDPAAHSSVSPEERAEIAAGGHDHVSHSEIPWGRLISSPQLWLIMAMYWFYVFGCIFFMLNLPKFLKVGRSFTDDEMKYCVSLGFAAGAIGNLIGGYLSDHLSRRFGLRAGRNLIGAASMALTGLLVLAMAFTQDKLLSAIELIVAFGIMDGMLPAAWALCLDVGKKYAGAVSGSMNMAGQASGAISTALYGYLTTAYGYNVPLLIYVGTFAVSAVLFLLIDPTRQLIPETAEVAEAAAPEPACA